MIAVLELCGNTRRFDLEKGVSIAIPLRPGGPQPSFFSTQPATDVPLTAGTFTGEVCAGGSCNARVITFAPHCHGTHTECCGHLTDKPRDVQDVLPDGLIPARVVTVTPTAPDQTEESCPGEPLAGEGLITTSDLALEGASGCRALVIRTLPNPTAKQWRDYGDEPAYPVLTLQASQALVRAGIEHLLIDTPSVDRADDGGRLTNHRIFWGMAPDGRIPSVERERCTITEMIYVPDSLADGPALLSLGVSPLAGDASPSAPMVFAET